MVLGDALPVGRIVFAPAGQRIDVEIRAEDVDPLHFEHPIQVVDQPLPGLGITQVEDAVILLREPRNARGGVGPRQNPIPVVGRQPGVRRHALGLVPKDEIHPGRVGGIGDRTQALGKTDGIGGPRPDRIPPFPVREPARVEDPVIQMNTLPNEALDHRDLFLGRRLHVAPARIEMGSSSGARYFATGSSPRSRTGAR